MWPPSRIGLLDDPDIQGIDAAGAPVGGPVGAPAVAGLVTPGVAGAALTVPIAVWRRRRR